VRAIEPPCPNWKKKLAREAENRRWERKKRKDRVPDEKKRKRKRYGGRI
jgi:hypothetical protein